MVTHVPPSPISSIASLSSRRRPSSDAHSRSRSSTRQTSLDFKPPQAALPPTNFPPSPPTSYASPPSSYTARVYSRSDTAYTPTRAPSIDSRISIKAGQQRGHQERNWRRRTPTEYGPAAPAPDQNSFPWFTESGNVRISLVHPDGVSENAKYLLHGSQLAQNAGFFARSLDPEMQTAFPACPSGLSCHASPDSDRRSDGRRPRRRSSSRYSTTTSSTPPVTAQNLGRPSCCYELDWNSRSSGSGQDLPMLRRRSNEAADGVHVGSTREPPASSTGFFRRLNGNTSRAFRPLSRDHKPTLGVSSSRETKDIFKAYDNLFLILYNHGPRLDSKSISTAYAQCKTLLHLTVQYDAVAVVAPRIEHHLLRFNEQLWSHIARYPASYLKLAHLARSRTIFTEALVHVVGQWPASSERVPRGSVDSKVLDLIEDKAADLQDVKARVDGKLFRLTLTTSRGERITPNAWLDWLALSLFRQWFADNTTPAPQSILKGSSGSSKPASFDSTYRLLGVGDQAYLSHDEVKRFLKLHPDHYSRDNLRRFERRLDEVKHLAKEAVKPLTRTFLELDEASYRVQYLTCTRMDERDFDYIWRSN